jgi:PhnB protein
MAKKARRSAMRKGAVKARAAAKPARRIEAIPAGYKGITPYLTVRGAERAVEFYKKAFGARETAPRLSTPDGKIMHTEMKMFDQRVMLSDEVPDQGRLAPESLAGSSVSLTVYSRNVDAAMARAVTAGATVKMAAEDMFWGDRFGSVADPFGHIWHIATHKADVSPREMQKRWQAMLAEGPK